MTADSFDGNWLASIPQRSQSEHEALLRGEVLLSTRPHSIWGGAVTAAMYLPLSRSLAWQQLTDYPRWVQYFPDVVRSEVLHRGEGLGSGSKRLYQVANKAFLFFTAQVEVYLRVVETVHQKIQFRQEQGSFTDFAAELTLQEYGTGTLLAYSVQATPAIPIPAIFVQQAMQLDLPTNMRRMRQVLCMS